METNLSLSLSKLHGADQDDLQFVANKMQQYISTESEVVLDEITMKMNQRRGLIGVLFPSKIITEHDKLTIEKMRTLFKNREDMLAVYTNTQIELAKKAGEMIIASKLQDYQGELKKTHTFIQKDLVELINRANRELSQSTLDELNKLQSSFTDAISKFVNNVENQEKVLESITNKDSSIYRATKTSIDNNVDLFYAITKQLMDDFKTGLQTKIKDLTIL